MSYMQTQENKNTNRYYPKNIKKYKSNTPYCVCRSSWEVKFSKWCDNNVNVIEWGSETVEIPYFDPVTLKNRRYIPDFLLKVRNKDNQEKIWLVEVKPFKECVQPVITKGKSKKTKLYEQKTWLTNKNKWIYAQKYCKKKGWTFKLITEKELF